VLHKYTYDLIDLLQSLILWLVNDHRIVRSYNAQRHATRSGGLAVVMDYTMWNYFLSR